MTTARKNSSKVLLLVDDARLYAPIYAELGKRHYNVLVAEDDVMRTVFDEVPHLIIIDEDYRNGQGRKIAHEIKRDIVLKYIPIILIASHPERDKLSDSSEIDAYFKKGQAIQKLVVCAKEALAENYNELDLNPLTHLPGNRSCVLRIERVILSKKLFAVCYIDLSNLSAFNATYGDARGDQVIIRLGEILQESVKRMGTRDDFLGHVGGDDFILVTHPDLAESLSEEIIRHFDEAVPNFYDAHDRKNGYILMKNVKGELVQCPIMSVSIAIVHNYFVALTEVSEVSQVARELKNYMKQLPGSCFMKDRRHVIRNTKENTVLPTENNQKKTGAASSADKEEKFEKFIGEILKNKRIRTRYQPIIDLKTKRVTGYEALTSGTTNDTFSEPVTLFTMGRESGKIRELDQLCVEFALKNGQALPSDKKLFLNLNHETLIDPKFMRNLFSAKGSIGFKNIVIEVTEQSILRSFEKIRDALYELKSQGVSVAIDDVGGGAVSLRDVAVLKPDYIKFDRSLIRQIDTNITKQQIVLSMILFANGIKAQTTAEGIETKEEYETVLMCGVDLGQGYYFARPGPPFPEVLSANGD